MSALGEGAEMLARALRPANPPYAHGWGLLVGPCHAALLELVAAGWTPPGGDGADEDKRLRAEIASLSGRLDDLNRHLDRAAAEERAFAGFRGLLVQLAHPAGRNPLRLDSGRQYTAAEIQAWLVRLLDAADGRADASRRHDAQLVANTAGRRQRTQLALFEPPATPRGVEHVQSFAATAAGL